MTKIIQKVSLEKIIKFTTCSKSSNGFVRRYCVESENSFSPFNVILLFNLHNIFVHDFHSQLFYLYAIPPGWMASTRRCWCAPNAYGCDLINVVWLCFLSMPSNIVLTQSSLPTNTPPTCLHMECTQHCYDYMAARRRETTNSTPPSGGGRGNEEGVADRKLPVIVFLHGESFEWNGGNPYDGTVLASYAELVVVTLNYRLGILGE